MTNTSQLFEVSFLFLKLGTIGFGGPSATIAMMEHEAVEKRKWVSKNYFLEMLAATNLIPGPNATEMASHLGYIHAGLPGLITAGLSFILPSTVISLTLALLYSNFGALPEASTLLSGINPIVAAILTAAFLRLGKSSITDNKTGAIAAGSFFAAILGLSEIIILLLAGVVSIFFYTPSIRHLLPAFFGLPLKNFDGFSFQIFSDNKLAQLGAFFFKVGSLLFGDAYVMIAFIQSDIVNRFNWIDHQQMVDAIAASQITPGPISSTATFIGYLIAGYPGAIIATLGIFLPSFIIVFFTGKLLPKINKIDYVRNFLKGITAASVALIAFVAVSIYLTIMVDIWMILLTFFAVLLLVRYKVDAFYLIFLGLLYGGINFIIK